MNRLPQPIGRQKEVLCLPAQGHFVVLGTAGSGKTTLALYRSAYLSSPNTEHYGKTLLVTFNRTLVSYLRYLNDDNFENVVVENYHKFARGYLNARGLMQGSPICSTEERKAYIERSKAKILIRYQGHKIFMHPYNWFSEEISWIAKHGIRSIEAYQEATRSGREGAILSGKSREIIFEILNNYHKERISHGKHFDWDDIAMAVCDEFDKDISPRLYKHIILDEGQDFSPQMILSLVKAIPSDGSLTFFGDVAQQIYGNRTSWRSAGLNIKSNKIWRFKENYRNTKQIARLAIAISKMPYYQGITDIVEPNSPAADGPLPTLINCSTLDKEIALVISQATTSSKTLSVAILLRSYRDEILISEYLPSGCIKLHKEMGEWQANPGIYYGTYHSAKGLEFDIVILPFCTETRFPDSDTVEALGIEDGTFQDGKLLYVGVTRAKSRLLITHNGNITTLLPQDDSLYQKVSI